MTESPPTHRPDAPTTESGSKSGPSASYRRDIDGLRAAAIVPVLLFHGGFAGFSGGFIGVDIFFVISGYLITNLVQREIAAGEFGYVAFWERRARRILPPLFLVVLASCGFAYALLVPADLATFGQSVFAVSSFLSNVYFWLKAGYFAAPEETVPLLHTWSLAIEEQFYVLFPAILLLLAVASVKRRLSVVASIGILSFVASAWLVEHAPDGAYYLLPARIWELMVGAMLALLPVAPRLPRAVVDGLAATGILVIAGAVGEYDAATPFLGFAALMPTLATALLIWVGNQPGSVLRRLFTNRVAVYLGLRSYALYLWHWPLLVFWAVWANKPLSAVAAHEAAAVLAVSLLFASLSLRFVENPIRRREVLRTRGSIFAFCGVCLAVLGGFGLAAHFNGGFSSRLPPDALLLANSNDLTEDQALCGRDLACSVGTSADREPTFLVWGDSHARALALVLDETAAAYGYKGLLAPRGGCPPVFGFTLTGPDGPPCTARNDAVRDLIQRSDFDAVVLVGLWSAYLAPPIGHRDRPDAELSPAEIFAQLLGSTAEQIADSGARVYLLEEPPYPEAFRPARAAFAVWKQRDLLPGQDLGAVFGISVEDYRNRTSRPKALFERLTAEVPIEVISQEPFLCPDGMYCPAIADGRSIFRDDTHLSNHGAMKLTAGLRPIFAAMAEGDD